MASWKGGLSPEQRAILRRHGVHELWRRYPDDFLSMTEMEALQYAERKDEARRHLLSLSQAGEK